MCENNNNLKKTFSTIKDLRENTNNILIDIRNKLSVLENTYKELLEFNSDEHTTGLDSLYFQNKLFELQLVNNNNIFDIINNRIYGNYYKLYKEINNYILRQQYTLDNNDIKEFIVYKDLDNDEKYDFKLIIEIYNYIIQLLNILDNELINRKNKLNKQFIHRDCGLNIENLLEDISYTTSLLQNKVDLFNSTIQNINTFHIKYLTRFYNINKFFYKQLNNDITIENKNLNIFNEENSDEENNDNENINQENISQENINQENISQENINQENINQENINQENITNENITNENITNENITNENINQENITNENIDNENSDNEKYNIYNNTTYLDNNDYLIKNKYFCNII